MNSWFAGPARAEIDPDPRFGLQVVPLEDQARMFGDANPLSARSIQGFASRWSAFCRGRRPPVGRFGGWPTSKGWALEPPEIFDAPFPRLHRRTVQLSRLDEELLATFAGAEWLTPLAVMRGGGDGWPIAMSFLGDSLPARIRAWAEIKDGRYLATRPASEPGHKSAWNLAEYRLTDEGRAVLAKGAGSTSNIPEFPFGGFPARLPAKTPIRERGKGASRHEFG